MGKNTSANGIMTKGLPEGPSRGPLSTHTAPRPLRAHTALHAMDVRAKGIIMKKGFSDGSKGTGKHTNTKGMMTKGPIQHGQGQGHAGPEGQGGVRHAADRHPGLRGDR